MTRHGYVVDCPGCGSTVIGASEGDICRFCSEVVLGD